MDCHSGSSVSTTAVVSTHQNSVLVQHHTQHIAEPDDHAYVDEQDAGEIASVVYVGHRQHTMCNNVVVFLFVYEAL